MILTAISEIERIDDGEVFTPNEDGTFTMDSNRKSMPTCFYRYDALNLLNNSKRFRVSKTRKVKYNQ